MIKCFWYLKSLKQLFIISLISCFILLGNSFVNAAEWSFYNVDSDYPVWNTAFYFRPISSSTTILEWWWMTDPKAIIYLHNQVNSYHWDSLYFWGTDSTLYSVENPSRSSTDMVSYRANNFCKISWTDFTSKGRWNLCSDAQIVSSGSVYNDSSLKWEMTQIAFLEYDSFPQSQNYNAICFVYWNLWFSLCYYNSTVSPNYMSVSASIPWASLDPVSFNKDIIWISPWVSWGSWWSWNITWPTESINSTFTWDYTYYECTYNSLIDYAESVWYSPYLCRGGLSDFSTWLLTDISTVNPWTWKRLDEIYWYTSSSDQSSFEWFQYWQNVYQNPYVYSNSIWLNQPAVLRTYFTFYNQYGGVQWNFNDVYEYCLLKKFVFWDPTENWNSVYKWQYFKSTCEFLKNGGWNSYWWNWDHWVWTNWDWVGDFSWTTNQDWITFIQNAFNDLKANWFTFDKSELWFWFLPAYIITFLLAIIFFKFLSH